MIVKITGLPSAPWSTAIDSVCCTGVPCGDIVSALLRSSHLHPSFHERDTVCPSVRVPLPIHWRVLWSRSRSMQRTHRFRSRWFSPALCHVHSRQDLSFCRWAHSPCLSSACVALFPHFVPFAFIQTFWRPFGKPRVILTRIELALPSLAVMCFASPTAAENGLGPSNRMALKADTAVDVRERFLHVHLLQGTDPMPLATPLPTKKQEQSSICMCLRHKNVGFVSYLIGGRVSNHKDSSAFLIAHKPAISLTITSSQLPCHLRKQKRR